VDTFDHKPKLTADTDKPGKRPGTKLLGSKWKFAQHGKSGLWISELFPNIAKHADEMALVRSMQTDLPAHPQAFVKMHTGNSQFVRPSLGAWTLYGLGTENQNLPGFITLSPPQDRRCANYGSAFLPAIYQATKIGGDNRPVVGAQVRNIQTTLARRRSVRNSNSSRLRLSVWRGAAPSPELRRDEFEFRTLRRRAERGLDVAHLCADDRAIVSADFRGLIDRREKCAAIILRTAESCGRRERDEARQVLVFRAEAVERPRAERRADEL